MTDTLLAKEADGDFWLRVRHALEALRPVRREPRPAYRQAAIARAMGLKQRLGARIDAELADGWANAAARHVSLSLLVIELDLMTEYLVSYGKQASDECIDAIMRILAQGLPRPTDSCLRLGNSTFVVVLPDMPVLMARSTAAKYHEAIRHLGLNHKESHAGLVTASMGLAVSNPRGTYDRKFFEAAAEAVKKAQRKGLGRIEMVDLRPAQERKRRRTA
ncbi:MAG: diguanylate cyclase [Alphaproteobacteria bacterium]|nr:diguanylate cyclase [Alphaproteobacteria bacterium]